MKALSFFEQKLVFLYRKASQKTGLYVACVCVCLLVQCISLFLYAPALWIDWPDRFYDLVALSEHVFARDLLSDAVYPRMFYPLLGKLFFSSSKGMAFLQYTGTFLFLMLFFMHMKKRTCMRYAWWCTLGMGVSHTVVMSNIWWGYPDTSAWFFVMLFAGTSNLYFATVCVLCGWLCDERFLIASCFMMLWIAYENPWKQWVKNKVIPLFVGSVAALLFRCAWQKGWVGPGHPSTPWVDEYGQMFAWSGLLFIPMAFRFLWFFPVRLVVMGKKVEGFQYLWCAMLGMVVLECIAFVAGDLSRTASAAFPCVAMGMHMLYRQKPVLSLKYVRCAVLGCVCMPYVFCMGPYVRPIYPLALSALRAFYPSAWPF
jgi:hypothetical protein